MNFRLEPVTCKPFRRFNTDRVKNRREMFEANILEGGLYMKVLVQVMSPRLEQYFKNGEVAYIKIESNNVYLVLNDSSKVLVK